MIEGAVIVDEYDFFETPVIPYTTLVEGGDVEIHVRNTATMEQAAVRGVVSRDSGRLAGNVIKLNCYGRLGARIDQVWYMQVAAFLEDEALTTDHTLAQSLDIEQSLKSPEQFKKSRYRQDKDG